VIHPRNPTARRRHSEISGHFSDIFPRARAHATRCESPVIERATRPGRRERRERPRRRPTRVDARSRASDARRDAVDEAIRDAIVVGDS